MTEYIDFGLEQENKLLLKPTGVVKNFLYDPDRNNYLSPFASEDEYHGFLSGGEHVVLCTSPQKGETVVSKDAVQCSMAMIRNRRTGLVSVLHQSLWSAAAGIILGVQKHDDIDVILAEGRKGIMNFQSLDAEHIRPPYLNKYQQYFNEIDRTDWRAYPAGSERVDEKHVFGKLGSGSSIIKGITSAELQRMISESDSGSKVGLTYPSGLIQIPVERDRMNRWSLTYRPRDNVILIYESGTNQLFTYPGFDLDSK